MTLKDLSDKNIISPRVHTEKVMAYNEKLYNNFTVRKSSDEKELVKKSI